MREQLEKIKASAFEALEQAKASADLEELASVCWARRASSPAC